MLHAISWTHYLSGITLLTLIYYAFVAVRYYSNDLRHRLSGNLSKNHFASSGLAANGSEDVRTDTDQTDTLIDTSEDAFQKAEELIAWLKDIIHEASQKQYSKVEFMASLSAVLANYADLKKTAVQSAINELIKTESEKLGFLTLNEDELVKVWNEVM